MSDDGASMAERAVDQGVELHHVGGQDQGYSPEVPSESPEAATTGAAPPTVSSFIIELNLLIFQRETVSIV